MSANTTIHVHSSSSFSQLGFPADGNLTKRWRRLVEESHTMSSSTSTAFSNFPLNYRPTGTLQICAATWRWYHKAFAVLWRHLAGILSSTGDNKMCSWPCSFWLVLPPDDGIITHFLPRWHLVGILLSWKIGVQQNVPKFITGTLSKKPKHVSNSITEMNGFSPTT